MYAQTIDISQINSGYALTTAVLIVVSGFLGGAGYRFYIAWLKDRNERYKASQTSEEKGYVTALEEMKETISILRSNIEKQSEKHKVELEEQNKKIEILESKVDFLQRENILLKTVIIRHNLISDLEEIDKILNGDNILLGEVEKQIKKRKTRRKNKITD